MTVLKAASGSARRIASTDSPDAPGPPPTIVFVVLACVEAYHAPEVARTLVAAGARVIPVAARGARNFVGLEALRRVTGEPVHEEPDGYASHEALDRLAFEADVLLVAPVGPERVDQLAEERGDDMVSYLASRTRGAVVRCAMASPTLVAQEALAQLGPRDLSSIRMVVTAGPTFEDLDPVRFLGNRSSGKMGFAIAERAAQRGAVVELIAGPVTLETPYGAHRIDVRSAREMQRTLSEILGADLGGTDVLIMSAAVADYRPSEASSRKIKRGGTGLALDLVPNPDVLATIGRARTGRRPILVGFAVETESDERMVEEGRRKLEAKGVDLVVVNHAADAFGRDDNRAIFVDAAGETALGVLSKRDLADALLSRVAAHVKA